MTLQFELVRAVLVTEIALFLLLEIPVSSNLKRRVVKYLQASRHGPSVIGAMRVLISFISLLFIDALVRSVKLGSKYKKDITGHLVDSAGHHHHHGQITLQLKIFYAQRNLYLTGFTLALAFVLARYIPVLMARLELEDRVRVLEQGGVKQREMTVKQREMIESMEEEMKGLKKKSKESEAILKQVENQQREYDRLADEYQRLQKTVSAEACKDK